MSSVLARFNEIGTQKEIVYFLKSIIKENPITMRDLELLCMHSLGNMILRLDALIAFFDFIQILDIDNENNSAVLNEKGIELRNKDSSNLIIESIVVKTIKESFQNKILSSEIFTFDSTTNSFLFRPEKLSLDWAAIRNLLIECDFLMVQSMNISYVLTVNPAYEYLLSEQIKEQRRKISLEELKEQMLRNEESGEKAERYVLEYEKKRLNFSENSMKVKQISGIDVSAGYDIISFNGEESKINDRFIEVKATSKNFGFYWSSNEIQTAKVLGPRYYLYLVNLSKVSLLDYEPLIISDPVNYLKNSTTWIIEPQLFFVRKV